MSGTDTETSSDRDEPVPTDDLQGVSSQQYLFGRYQQAKKRECRFTGKLVRCLWRVLKKKGKGRGKRIYLNIDYFRSKGTGGSKFR